MRFKATIEQSRLIIEDRDKFNQHLRKLKDGEYFLSVDPPRRRRSNEANSYYWGGIVGTIVLYWEGWTKEEVHDWLKANFALERGVVKGVPNKILSTADMSVAEFYNYCEGIKIALAQDPYYVPIPDPDEYKEEIK